MKKSFKILLTDIISILFCPGYICTSETASAGNPANLLVIIPDAFSGENDIELSSAGQTAGVCIMLKPTENKKIFYFK